MKKCILSIFLLFSLLLSQIYSIEIIYATDDPTTDNIYEVMTEKTAVEQFVTRLYKEVLGRDPEPTGLKYWTDVLLSGTPGAKVAHGFFFSKEFQNKPLTSEQYIDIHYRTLLDRTADPGGRSYWIDLMNLGMPRENIYSGFVNSKEFTSICAEYGIVRGTYIPPPNGMTRAFITRLYKEALGRNPDIDGLTSWIEAISNGVTGAYVAHSLLFSPEMAARKLNNEKFIDVLFKSLLNRSPLASEEASLVNRLNNGASRYNIFSELIKSSEFAQICKKHGILQGRPIDTTKPMIALTFDDGPMAVTGKILDILEEYDAIATFYLNGYKVIPGQSSILRAFNIGCEIGNHGWSHTDLTILSYYQVRYEIVETSNIIKSITGQSPATFRPAYGRINSNVTDAAVEIGLPILLWTLDSQEWNSSDPLTVSELVINNAKPGDIVLMHDTYDDAAASTKRIVSELSNKGFQFVTVSELLLFSNIVLAPGQVYGVGFGW